MHYEARQAMSKNKEDRSGGDVWYMLWFFPQTDGKYVCYF